eukprot:13112-Heterococcus_DN1.PRE.6
MTASELSGGVRAPGRSVTFSACIVQTLHHLRRNCSMYEQHPLQLLVPVFEILQLHQAVLCSALQLAAAAVRAPVYNDSAMQYVVY